MGDRKDIEQRIMPPPCGALSLDEDPTTVGPTERQVVVVDARDDCSGGTRVDQLDAEAWVLPPTDETGAGEPPDLESVRLSHSHAFEGEEQGIVSGWTVRNRTTSPCPSAEGCP